MSMKPDKKMDEALKKKFAAQREAARAARKARGDGEDDLGKTQYNDEDDDTKGFKAADREEEADMEFGG